MKFIYDKADTETRECVAYIDGEGCLCVKDEDGETFYMLNNNLSPYVMGRFNPVNAVKKFYRGDSVTITF